MNNCPFCNSLKNQREICEDFKREKNTTKFDVALVQNSYYNNFPTGSASTSHFELNFCPVCGRKVEKDELTV